MSLRVSFLSGSPDLLGLNASLAAFHPLDLEAGASVALGWAASGTSGYGRMGVALGLFDARSGWMDGWTGEIIAHAGYRYVGVIEGFVGEEEDYSVHGFTLTGGLDFIDWRRRDLGLSIQLIGGVFVAHDPHLTRDLIVTPEFRLSIGFAAG